MPYITIKQVPMQKNISLEDLLLGTYEGKSLLISNNESNTRTYFTKTLSKEFRMKFSIQSMINRLAAFCEKYEELYNKERNALYYSFLMPKSSGGYRRIDAPETELKLALYELKDIFEVDMFASYHTSAFAYIKKRSTIDALKRHQANESWWYLKTDFSNFFGSTTPDFLMSMLSMIFPFSEIMEDKDGKVLLEKALDLCFLNGGLPQGTPISPMLTNLMMIPIDHKISNTLRDFNKKSYVYTRYADDMIISCEYNFKFVDVIELINQTCAEFNAPFKIKQEKTRYGSRSNANWNLGLIINKDNDITVGNKEKKRLRALITNYVLDKQNGKNWPLEDVQVFEGTINYHYMVEPDYLKKVVETTNKKYNIDLINMIRKDKNVI